MEVPSNQPILPVQSNSPGELVLCNGHQSGARRPLAPTSTLLGQASHCDLRLSGEGIAPVHCILIQDSQGLLLRDLGSPTGTYVNGKPVHTHRLSDGDILELGPLQLSLSCSTPPTAEAPTADAVLLVREREALRIQVAAVAAQQVALTEEEARLEQQSLCLLRQEDQLSGHLNERQAKLEQLQEQIRVQRAGFEAERSTMLRELRAQHETIEREFAELSGKQGELAKQRDRLKDLRRRLFRRYRRQWEESQVAIKRREAEVVASQETLQRERTRIQSFYERVNGELELGRRQIQEQAQQLALDQQRWEKALNVERSEQLRHQIVLQEQIKEAQTAQNQLDEEQRRWVQYKAQLEREVEGLESRIRNQRTLLESLQRNDQTPSAGIQTPVVGDPLPLSPVFLPDLPATQTDWPEELRRLVGILTDQRAHLMEHWQQLLRIHQSWMEERNLTIEELAGTAEQITHREKELDGLQKHLRDQEEGIRRRQESLTAMRNSLEGWKTELKIQEATWVAEKSSLLQQFEEREAELERKLLNLAQEVYRQEQSQQDDLLRLADARVRCEEARNQYSDLWQECERLREALSQQERTLASRALALDRLREELAEEKEDSTRVEIRYQQLVKQEASRLDADSQAVVLERHRLLGERTRLDEDTRRLRILEQQVEARVIELNRQQSEWQKKQSLKAEEEVLLQREVDRLRNQNATDQHLLRELKEEIERLARSLMDDGDTNSTTVAA